MSTSSTDCVSRGHFLIGTQFMPLDGKRVELPLQLVLVDGLVLVCMQAWGSAQPAGLCDVRTHACWCACMHVLKTASRQHSLQDGVMLIKCMHAGQHGISTACRTRGLVPPVVSMHAGQHPVTTACRTACAGQHHVSTACRTL